MKIFTCIAFFLMAHCAFAQTTDSVITDTLKKPVLKTSSTKMLMVLDGVPIEGHPKIDPKDVMDVYILAKDRAIYLYGDKGKNGAILVETFNGVKRLYQWKLSRYSGAYKVYLSINNNDDSGLVYLLNGVALDGGERRITSALEREIKNIQTVNFIEKFSQKPNNDNPKPIVVITTTKKE